MILLLAAYAPVRVKPFINLEVRQVLASKEVKKGKLISITGRHKTGHKCNMTLGHEIISLLESFINGVHFELFGGDKWKETPVFCSQKGTKLDHLSSVIRNVSQEICGKPFTMNSFRHSISTHVHEIDSTDNQKKKAAKALYHSEDTQKKNYVHTKETNDTFICEYMKYINIS